jgi:UPF0755 protein
MKKKNILIFSGIALVVLIFLFVKPLFSKQGSFESNEKVFFLNNDTTPEEVIEALINDSIVSDERSFRSLIKLKNVERFKSGRYKISKGIRTNQLINKLRAGLQDPVLVKVDGVRDVYNLAGSLARQLKNDSAQFIHALLDPELLRQYELTPEEAMCLILPNTYELYWNISPDKFMDRMLAITNEYWTEARVQKASEMKLSKSEIYTLASIVKGETVKKEEAPKIAGLYLNRLRKGMPLEADPTITFALNLKRAQRVYLKDLKVASPYNTYKNKGLPPGPIFMVEPHFLDAVLNAEKHNFIFMCAQKGGTGLHNFSTNFNQHSKYAREYRQWLNANNIR